MTGAALIGVLSAALLAAAPAEKSTRPTGTEASNYALRVTGVSMLLAGVVLPIVLVPSGFNVWWNNTPGFSLSFNDTPPPTRGQEHLARAGGWITVSGLAAVSLIPIGITLLSVGAVREKRRVAAEAAVPIPYAGPGRLGVAWSLRF
jgi:hypothetical protein